MKKIIVILLTVSILSCKTEKAITKSEPVLGITENSKLGTGFASNNDLKTENSNIEEKVQKTLSIREELTQNGIQVELQNIPLSDWTLYYNSIEKNKSKISNKALLYSYRKLLEQFDLYTVTLQKNEKQNIYTVLEVLINNKWSNYTKIYKYLSYFKSNEIEFSNWRSLQTQFKTYGRVMIPIKSTKPLENDITAEVLKNEAFLKEIQTIEKAFFEAQECIAKIHAL